MANKASDLYQNMVRVDEPEARVHLDLPDGLLPLALNVELPGGYVSEVVPCGVRLPYATTTMFSTADSFQMAAEFHVLMGNRPLARDGIELCRIRVRNIKWSGAGVPQIELRFELDAAGLLTVSAANLDRSNAEIVVFTAGDEVTQNDIQQALADALDNKRLAGAGIDVFSREPMSPDNPLLRVTDPDRLLLSPHTAWAPVEALETLVGCIERNIETFLAEQR